MKHTSIIVRAAASLIFLALAAVAGQAQAHVHSEEAAPAGARNVQLPGTESLEWQPDFDFAGASLRVSGPEGF